jgi:hypothetical protein
VGPHPRDRQRRPPKHATRQAEDDRQALAWRESWRAEAAETKRGANALNGPADPEQAKRRARFAAGIARSEFGRFYWDARREGGMVERSAMDKD